MSDNETAALGQVALELTKLITTIQPTAYLTRDKILNLYIDCKTAVGFKEDKDIKVKLGLIEKPTT